jgi:hypothetical protein
MQTIDFLAADEAAKSHPARASRELEAQPL